jgi:hypothetical protein
MGAMTIGSKIWRKRVLEYDPFASGGCGDTAVRQLQDTIVVASIRLRDHECWHCHGRMEAGTLTRVIVCIVEESLCRYRQCQDCCDAQARDVAAGDWGKTLYFEKRQSTRKFADHRFGPYYGVPKRRKPRAA